MKKVKEALAVGFALGLEYMANGKRYRKEKRKEKEAVYSTEAGKYTGFFWHGRGWAYVKGNSMECMKAVQEAIGERKAVIVVKVEGEMGGLEDWINRALLDCYLSANEEALFLWETARYAPVVRNGRYTEFVIHMIYNTNPRIDRLVTDKVQALAGCFRGDDYSRAMQVSDFLAGTVRYTDQMAYSVFNVLFEGIGTCRGYALAFQMIMKAMGIECHMVAGYGVKDKHCWNAVKLDGTWYSWDPTWVANNMDYPWLGWQKGIEHFQGHKSIDYLDDLKKVVGN